MNPNTQYSTLAVPATRRFDYWKEVVCRHCLAADSKPLSQSRFDGSLTLNTVGALDICTLSSPLHYWERSNSTCAAARLKIYGWVSLERAMGKSNKAQEKPTWQQEICFFMTQPRRFASAWVVPKPLDPYSQSVAHRAPAAYCRIHRDGPRRPASWCSALARNAAPGREHACVAAG